MLLPANRIIVKYRYVITMKDSYKTLDNIVSDWTTTKLNRIYNGKLLLLVSPIYYIQDSNDIAVQLQIDVDNPKSKEDIFYRCVDFVKKYKGTYFTYTGKSGFHIYSDYMYLIPNGRSMSIQDIRNKILYKYDLSIIGESNIDTVSSIRHMPTIRIGYRSDTRKLAFPILKYDYKWFLNKQESKNFKSIMSLTQLQIFIKSKLFPNKIVKY